MAVNFGKKTRERLSKGKPKLVNGAGGGGGGDNSEAEETETDSGVGVESDMNHSRKLSNTPIHDMDAARTMQVSSV